MLLNSEVASMNIDNFIVRPKRRVVEKYADPKAWEKLSFENLHELSNEVAGLPAGLDPEDEEAKRFDLLMLKIQLAIIRPDISFDKLVTQVKSIANLLEEKYNIPMVNEQMLLIQDLQTHEWWQDVTIPMLERVRRRLRSLVKFIDKHQRHIVYTDFEDEMGNEKVIKFPTLIQDDEFEQFKKKARDFLRSHQQHVTVHKLRMNKPLTDQDLDELERIMTENGVGNKEELEKVKTDSNGLGLFVRNLVGLDREAAKGAFAEFLQGNNFSSNQIEFVDMIINHLTEKGIMETGLLYESPFTDIAPRGPEDIFTSDKVTQLIDIINKVHELAIAA
jgi:type I restriction enzyme R subunit